MLLTKDDVLFILQLIEEKYGGGYSDEPKIAKLQTKLSIMLEAPGRLAVSQNVRTIEAGASVTGVKIDRMG